MPVESEQVNETLLTGRGILNSSCENIQQIGYSDFKNKEVLFDTVESCQNGDTEAMGNLYNAYKSPPLKLAYRFTKDFSLAEDVIQDIFTNIFTDIKKLKSPEALNGWLYRIAVNTCMSFARKRRKTKEVSLEEVGNMGHS